MGPIGFPEMVAIFIVALLLFGPKKLPELGRTLGKAISEFRRAKNELKATFESHLTELERETRIQTNTSSNSANDYSSSSYSYPYEEYNGYRSGELPAPSEAPAPEKETPAAVAVVADTVPRASASSRPIDEYPHEEEPS